MPIVNGGVSGSSSFHGCKAFNSAVISCSNGVATALTLDSEEYDTDGFHSTSANTSRFTIPAGLGDYYLITVGGFWAANPTNGSSVRAIVNGTTNVKTFGGGLVGAADYVALAVVAKLVVGDYVEGYAQQSSSGAINFGNATADDARATVSVSFLGA